MRLVIDLQGAQSDSRGRGIGRYSRSLALAMAAEPGPHQVIIALNGGFQDATEELRDAFAPLLPQDQVQVWHGPGRQTAWLAEDAGRRRAAERIRGAFLAALRPDLLLITSTFEGYGDDAVTALPPDMRGPPAISVCYDLIPLLRPGTYLANPVMRRWYYRALLQLQHSAGLLAISASGQAEILATLDIPSARVANILAGVGPHFRPAAETDEPLATLLARYGLHSGYILCVGAVEERKNLAGLIQAYATLPQTLRHAHPLVATGWNDPHQLPPLRQAAAQAGLAADELRLLTTFVPDQDLPGLYRGSAVTVCPSLHEGFGLSAAEAMACGAAVICSDLSSLPEVIGRADATFDPTQPSSIAERLRAVLEQPAFRDDLRRHGRARSRLFTWSSTAQRAWDALERFAPPSQAPRSKPRLAVVTPLADSLPELAQILVRLSRDYAVCVVSDDPAPAEAMLAAAFPPHPPSWLATCPPDRLLFLPGDDPHHTALTLRLLGGYAGIVVAGPRPAAAALADAVGAADADLLSELLLHHYGWHAAIVARNAEPGWLDRFPLEPVLRGRAVALLDLNAATLTAEIIERCYAANPHAAAEVCATGLADDGAALPEVARALAATFREDRPRTLFLDVSMLAGFDAGTGIQRVVREIVRQLGYADGIAARVEPVRSGGDQVVLATAFGRALWSLPDVAATALPAGFAPGDVFVCLDLNVHDIDGLAATLHAARAGGARTVVVIYDLLPALQPAHFPATVQRAFPIWLHMIASVADGLLCISRTVADEVLAWLQHNPPVRTRPLDVGWFHLGADFDTGAPVTQRGGGGRPKLLMVGTVEPRKGHAEALDAMDAVWRDGVDIDLVIAGKGGWHTAALQARLRAHPEAGHRLHWIETATDAHVSALYRSAAALLMASEGEGFGLPIVEAAHAGLPVIARDLPVFREICADSALYFRPGELAATVRRWLAMHAAGTVPDPAGITVVSWAEASRRLASIVLDQDWHARVAATDRRRQ